MRSLAAALLVTAACGAPAPPPGGSVAPDGVVRPEAPPEVPPPAAAPRRELRGAWVATVSNIDWPSKKGLPAAEQRAEALRILDGARDLRLNAIVLQVRSACDAIYPSELEPWSPVLSGASGQAPAPAYDPLAFWVEEAHRRGIELHAWINPYRAGLPGRGALAPTHISRRRPELVRSYGDHLWLDPGEPAVRDHVAAVVEDLARRYDIDGVHLDDYFYPYRSYAGGADFPDAPSWDRYQAGGGALPRADWRRDNVNTMVRRLHGLVRAVPQRPWLRFGVSPFGIWKSGTPPPIRGLSAYDELYADSRRWLQEGWVDYLAPQLYWPIAQTAQSFTTLLDWWLGEDRARVPLWPGLYTSRIGDGTASAFAPQEILDQIGATRARGGLASGNLHFSMRALLQDRQGIAAALREGPYAERALVPAVVEAQPGDGPPPPSVVLSPAGERAALELRGEAFLFVVYIKAGGAWRAEVVPAAEGRLLLPAGASAAAVAAVDRLGRQGPSAAVPL